MKIDVQSYPRHLSRPCCLQIMCNLHLYKIFFTSSRLFIIHNADECFLKGEGCFLVLSLAVSYKLTSLKGYQMVHAQLHVVRVGIHDF